ncbi:hypothetical protein M9Y10_002882 [Tritrichomonas musculus]|uniref:BTB domain-containing protein n=1 Tax=Tritrichomonas musculus TaxID=1915356 RepID=A0ABR2LB13_9EUKA
MKNFKLKILPIGIQNDLTIIYKEKENKLHEIKVSKSDFLHTLRYFQSRINEINKTKNIFIQEDINFDIFETFISSISTKEIEINENNYKDYYYLSHKYEYIELETQIKEFILKRPDLFHIIDGILQEGEDNIDYIKEEIISKNLDVVLQNELLKNVPIQPLLRILSSPKRILKNHHLLFSFVIEKLNSNEEEKENLSLLTSCLDYSEMSSDEIEKLIEIHGTEIFMSPSNSKERMKTFISSEKLMKQKNQELEQRIIRIESDYNERIRRLEKQMNKMEANYNERIQKLEQKIDEISNVKSCRYIEYDGNIKNCLNGIIQHLTNESNGNVDDMNIVKVTSSSSTGAPHLPRCVVDLNDKESYFHSCGEQNGWLKYDFLEKKIKPTHYAIRTRNSGKNCNHLNSWVIEGSNTNKDDDWIELDSQKGLSCLDYSKAKQIFDIKRKLGPDESYRYLRLRVTGETSPGRYYILISALEYFGYIIK